MEVPRQIFVTESGEFCEFGDVLARSLKYPKGFPLSDEEAKRVGLLDYLEAYDKAHTVEQVPEPEPTPAEAKAVAQTEVEDKAVSGPTEEQAAAAKTPKPPPPPDPDDDPGKPKTGVDFPPETRRIGGGGRRGS